jgi:SAM-dependent methyltransferase
MVATPAVNRFAFGKNWQSFAAIADEESISEAQRGLVKLFPNGELRGARILDVGCGSGLSMAAALRLGASQVDGVDIDPDSIEPHAAFFRSLMSERIGPLKQRICSGWTLGPMMLFTVGVSSTTPAKCGARSSA